MAQARLRIQGMDCATCTKILEHVLEGEPGVQGVVANYMLDVAAVDYDPTQTDVMRLLSAVASKTSYRARLA